MSNVQQPSVKVGILTFHDGFNHGGYFQAFSLLSYLWQLNIDASIINYKNKTHWLNEYKAFVAIKNPKRLFLNIKKIRSFRKDQRKMKLFPAELMMSSTKLASASKYFDFILIGSDIVWDYDYKLTGNDLAYFGDNLHPKYGIISYAPSMGRSKNLPTNILTKLNSFIALSARDENTKTYLDNNLGVSVPKVLDPTLLIHQQFFADLIPPKHAKNDKFILIYAYTLPTPLLREIEAFAAVNSLRIVSIGYPQPLNSEDFTDLGPLDWLRYFKEAEFVLTSTFHGTIFSIIFKKRFLTFNNKAISHKVVSLLSDLKLTSRIIPEKTFSLSDSLKKNIDWHYVDQLIAELRRKSASYLSQALSSDKYRP